MTVSNEELKPKHAELELKLVSLESIKQENDYLKNKITRASQIEEYLKK